VLSRGKLWHEPWIGASQLLAPVTAIPDLGSKMSRPWFGLFCCVIPDRSLPVNKPRVDGSCRTRYPCRVSLIPIHADSRARWNILAMDFCCGFRPYASCIALAQPGQKEQQHDQSSMTTALDIICRGYGGLVDKMSSQAKDHHSSHGKIL
jgi:hypothetical protein